MRNVAQGRFARRVFERAVGMAIVLVPSMAIAQAGSAGSVSAWRSGFADDPHGGGRVPFISRSAELDSPDADIIGLTVRCGRAGPEAILVVADPLPPRGHAQVTLAAAGSSDVVDATPIPTGAGLVLPIDVRVRATGSWGRGAILATTLVHDGMVSRANFALDGFGGALARLESECMLARLMPR